MYSWRNYCSYDSNNFIEKIRQCVRVFEERITISSVQLPSNRKIIFEQTYINLCLNAKKTRAVNANAYFFYKMLIMESGTISILVVIYAYGLKKPTAVEYLLTQIFMADSHPDWLNFRSFYENMMWFNKKQSKFSFLTLKFLDNRRFRFEMRKKKLSPRRSYIGCPLSSNWRQMWN